MILIGTSAGKGVHNFTNYQFRALKVDPADPVDPVDQTELLFISPMGTFPPGWNVNWPSFLNKS